MKNIVKSCWLRERSTRTRLRKISTLLVCLSTPIANADLSSTSLKNLIEQSDVIVFAHSIKVEKGSNGAGYAILTAEKAIKGTAPSENFRITWSSEVHEQQIDANDNRLLFLKGNANGEYTGTQYGRSYWNVETDSSINPACSSYTKYRYPINMIVIDTKYIDSGLLINNYLKEGRKSISILCLDNVQSIFQ